MGAKLSLCFGVCRIALHMAYKKICCIADKAPTPELSVICLGLTNTGKSTMLAALNKEPLLTQPTIGFSIKAVHMVNCILNVKEIGGSDQVRPYWSRYFDSSDGVIFVVNGSAEDLYLESSELERIVTHPTLQSLPVLILATHSPAVDEDVIIRDVDQLSEDLNIELRFRDRPNDVIIQPCRNCTDTDAISQGLTRLSMIIMGNMNRQHDQINQTNI